MFNWIEYWPAKMSIELAILSVGEIKCDWSNYSRSLCWATMLTGACREIPNLL